jgi:uncharacterized protein YaaN involved in tellurite resistance
LLPDLSSLTELRAVSTLYVPEVEPEATRLSQTFQKTCVELETSMVPRLLNYKSGDPAPAPEIERKSLSELTQAASTLEKRLIDLAKQNQPGG